MTYTIVNDSLPAGESESTANFINALGEIAGNGVSGSGDSNVVITWSTTGAATELPDGQGDNTYTITGLNYAGDVIADGSFDGGNQQGLLWTAGATAPIILNDAGGKGYDFVEALDRTGDSVGESETAGNGQASNGWEAVYWNASGISTVLANGGPGSDYSDAVTISKNGDKIGGIIQEFLGDGYGDFATEWSSNGSILWESRSGTSSISSINNTGAAVGTDGNNAVYWSPTGVETVLGAGTSKNPDRALAINKYGNSIGSNYNDTTAYEWSKTGEATILGKLPGADLVFPSAINYRDTVVGNELDERTGVRVAVSWSKTGRVVNLQSILGSGWSDTEATGINGAGDICGWGLHNGANSAWELLWEPPGGSSNDGRYVNAMDNNVLAASTLHTTENFDSVGHGSG
jgi:hypothetical protein